ncbi:Trypsin-like peptidase domain-containing protein [Arsukibacterium tuosuense]|uniref:Trypsin-like peptidase domain-containing protein n=2 Tax=Arsukibacterium tuosuense TaxID=1323745 RepID=A0A285J2C2_9GAMM|nr:Trypsin-like peptidase domain-containing protein [Arsukibacterium tuosuense]
MFTGPLFAVKPDECEFIHGTAFIIAPGYALTATHVWEDYLKIIEKRKLHETLKPGAKLNFMLMLRIDLPSGDSVHFSIERIQFHLKGDISVLEIIAQEGFDWSILAPYPTLRLNPPHVNESIYAYGFPNSSVEIEADGRKGFHVWTHLSAGTVNEVHETHRDKILLKFPCYQVDALLLGGMSGGPITDSQGNICGVIASSHTLEIIGDESPIGYASTLWPILGVCLEQPLGKKKYQYPRLIRLFRTKVIKSIDIDHFELICDPEDFRLFLSNKNNESRIIQLGLAE